MAKSTPEGKVKDKIKKTIKALGFWYYMPSQNGMGVSGIPDLIVCAGGLFIGIETKAPGKLANVTPNQQARIDEINGAGGLAVVTDDPVATGLALRAVKTLLERESVCSPSRLRAVYLATLQAGKAAGYDDALLDRVINGTKIWQ